jgi:hypothetical protein
MPYAPLPSDVHVDAALTNLSLAYMQDETRFIADRVFTPVPVDKQSDKYFVWSREEIYRDSMEKRAPGNESAGSGFSVSTDTYYSEQWALHKDVPEQLIANADPAADPVAAANRYLAQQAMIRKEREFATTAFATSIWTTDWAGVSASPTTDEFLQFDQSGSDPIETVLAAKDAVALLTGYDPVALVVGVDVHRTLKTHSVIKDAVKYTQRAVIRNEMIAELFEVDDYLVSRAVYNTAADGDTASYSFALNPKAMLLVYRTPTPAINEPSAGYTFSWTGLMGANAIGGRVKRYTMEHLASDRVEIDLHFDMKVTAADTGAFLSACIA